MLPESTLLGTLTILEIYQFYDVPTLFVCRNQLGQFFLVNWVDEDDEATDWHYLPISLEKLLSVRHGKIDLHTAFAQPENEWVFCVTLQSDHAGQDTVVSKRTADIDPADFPLPETVLNVPYTLPQIVWGDVDQRERELTAESAWLTTFVSANLVDHFVEENKRLKLTNGKLQQQLQHLTHTVTLLKTENQTLRLDLTQA